MDQGRSGGCRPLQFVCEVCDVTFACCCITEHVLEVLNDGLLVDS